MTVAGQITAGLLGGPVSVRALIVVTSSLLSGDQASPLGPSVTKKRWDFPPASFATSMTAGGGGASRLASRPPLSTANDWPSGDHTITLGGSPLSGPVVT